MPTIARDVGGTSSPPPPGTHRAICCQVIELGVLPQDQFAERFKVMIGFELCDVEIDAQDENGVAIKRKQIVSKEYTLSIGDKSNLGKDLVSWRGRPFTKEEKDGFVLDKLLGVPALLSIQLATTRTTGREYAKIAAIMGPQKADRENFPGLVSEKLHYEVNDYHDGSWNQLPQWVQDKISTSEEHTAMAQKKARDGEPSSHESSHVNTPDDDEVPF